MELPQSTPQCTDGPLVTPGLRINGIADLLPARFHVDSVYLHVPFCRHRCHYCDFFTLAGREEDMAGYVDRVVDELCVISDHLEGSVQTVFFGGGTPTLLPPDLLARVLEAVQTSLPLDQEVEWTVEANPETVTEDHARALAAGGVNRVSIGAQSFDPALLSTLERQHDPDNVRRSMQLVARAGISRTSIDLIYAIPGQTLDAWNEDLQQAIDLGMDHLSCYGLVYEQGTPLTRRRDQGRIVPVPDSLEAEMHIMAREVLGSHGFEQYEISNWCKPGQACRHNLVYWTNGNWWPIGPGASGHVDGVRWKNEARLGSYVSGQGLSAATQVERVDDDAHVGEAFMMGLRLRDGLDACRLTSLLETGTEGPRRRGMIELHVSNGLLEWKDGGIRFTDEGILLSDTVLKDLL